MRVRSLTGTRRHLAVLSCLAAAWLCVMAPLPAAARQNADEAEGSAEQRAARKQPPTILATQPFFLAPTQLVGCFAQNFGPVQNIAFTLRAADGSVVTDFGGAMQEVDLGLTQPAVFYCEFTASDVTPIRASGVVFTGGRILLQVIPAR